MAGVLSFTLGLEASNFLRNLGMASGGVLSFAGAMRGIQAIASGVWGAINQGGELSDLAARTGESAGNLYQLQESFKLVGVRAEALPSILRRLQTALGGVDENGNKTGELFSRLGLDEKKLGAMNAVKQIESVAAALGRVGQQKGTFLASQLFGREGAGDIMQVARQLRDFQQSIGETSGAAGVANRTAEVFNRIGHTVQRIRTQMRGLWMEIAERLSPVIQWSLDKVMDAFKGGDFSVLIGESFKLGFDFAVLIAPAAFAKLGAILLKAIETPLARIQGVFEWLLPTSKSWNQIQEESVARGPVFNLGFGDFTIADMSRAANEEWDMKVAEFRKRFGVRMEPNASTSPLDDLSDLDMAGLSRVGGGSPGGSAWEKLGFVLGGGRSSSDHARRTADNTRLMIAEQKRTNALLQQGPRGGSFDRIN